MSIGEIESNEPTLEMLCRLLFTSFYYDINDVNRAIKKVFKALSGIYSKLNLQFEIITIFTYLATLNDKES